MNRNHANARSSFPHAPDSDGESRGLWESHNLGGLLGYYPAYSRQCGLLHSENVFSIVCSCCTAILILFLLCFFILLFLCFWITCLVFYDGVCGAFGEMMALAVDAVIRCNMYLLALCTAPAQAMADMHAGPGVPLLPRKS